MYNVFHILCISGDNWSIVCSGKYWNRKDKVRIKNVVTE
jgi:hypothetical protein